MNTKPNYQPIDTYMADFLNENPPRREDVTEIQDRESGLLLCYAMPGQEEFITRSCNSHAALVEALEKQQDRLSQLSDSARTEDDIRAFLVASFTENRAALALAKGGTPEPSPSKKAWSVLLRYPDYIADDFPSSTYYDFAECDTPQEAVEIVRTAAVSSNPSASSDDFAVIGVWAGNVDMELGEGDV